MKRIETNMIIKWLDRSVDINGHPSGVVNELVETKFFFCGLNYKTVIKNVQNVGNTEPEQKRQVGINR